MLILTRRPGESLRIGDDIEINILAAEAGRVSLAITAPPHISILRSELLNAREANREAVEEQTPTQELLGMIEGAAQQKTPTQPLHKLIPAAKHTPKSE